MYTLDTNTIIYYLKEETTVVDVLDPILAQGVPLYVAAMTELELFSFSGLSGEEMQNIESILSTMTVIPLDSRMARIAASLRQSYRIKAADSIIAATALFTRSILLTRNVRDFQRIPKLQLQKI